MSDPHSNPKSLSDYWKNKYLVEYERSKDLELANVYLNFQLREAHMRIADLNAEVRQLNSDVNHLSEFIG